VKLNIRQSKSLDRAFQPEALQAVAGTQAGVDAVTKSDVVIVETVKCVVDAKWLID
jgi:hypothetical protein